MKEIKLEIRIHSLQYDELTPQDRELMDKAKEATSRSYAPYSKFSVGAAALLKNGVIVTGTNQENAAYPSGTCAERTTLFYASVSASHTSGDCKAKGRFIDAGHILK